MVLQIKKIETCDKGFCTIHTSTIYIYLLWIFRKSREATVHISMVGAVLLVCHAKF